MAMTNPRSFKKSEELTGPSVHLQHLFVILNHSAQWDRLVRKSMPRDHFSAPGFEFRHVMVVIREHRRVLGLGVQKELEKLILRSMMEREAGFLAMR
jgi:hypothetical protein